MKEYKPFTISQMTKLFYKYTKLNLKIILEYKLDRGLLTIAVFAREVANVIIMYLILTRFIHIRGWGMKELFFLYSFLFLSYSLFVFLFTGIRDFDDIIYTGEFDRYLIRPMGLMFQVISSKVDICATIAHGAVGILLLSISVNLIGIQWNLQNIIYYIMVLIGGAFIQASLFMISSCFSFWAIKTINLRNLIFFNSRRISGYPITFYPWLIKILLMFIVPFAFVNYFPAQYFIRNSDLSQFWTGFLYLTPVVGILMFILVFNFWRYGLKHYSSAGNSAY